MQLAIDTVIHFHPYTGNRAYKKMLSSEEDDISSAPRGSPTCREREGLDLAKLTVDELRKLGADMELSVGNCRKRSDHVDAFELLCQICRQVLPTQQVRSI